MRTEDDLRAALVTLERHAPAAATVLPARTRSVKRIRLLAGVTTAAALAGLVTAVTLTTATHASIPNGSVAPAVPPAPATLRAKLLAAFSATAGEIVYERSTLTAGTTSVTQKWYYPWQASPGRQVRSRQLILNADGTPYQDVEDIYTMPAPGTTPAGLPANVAGKLKGHLLVGVVAARGEIIDVEYGTKTWSDQKDHLLLDDDPGNPATVAYDIQHADWKVVGNTTLGGQAAIELSWKDAGSATYLWASARTYLPLREIATIPVGGPGRMTTTTMRTDYELLPAAPANLAKLTPPIPAGFRQTSTQVLPRSGPGVG